MLRNGRFRRRIACVTLALALAPVGAWLAQRWWSSNFGVLEPGRIYRSGQMTAADLDRTIRGRGIRTVLNLRGVNPGAPWYRAERATTTAAGATQVDVSMSSCEWMSRAQLRAVVRALDSCEYPLLIHCQWGAERTGLVSAFAALLRPGGTLDDARSQFSAGYLFVRVKDGKVMAEHLDQYETWLQARGEGHTPGRFRAWAAQGFRPGSPCREQWPYDPYPLVAVSRPAPATEAAGALVGRAAPQRLAPDARRR